MSQFTDDTEPYDGVEPWHDDPAYLAFQAEQEAIHDGLATELVHCYLCWLEATGTADCSPRQDQGPLRGVVGHGCTGGFDPYATVKLTCGHTLI